MANYAGLVRRQVPKLAAQQKYGLQPLRVQEFRRQAMNGSGRQAGICR